MPQDQIFYPMGALALLTFLVLALIPIRRFRAGFAGRIVPDDFKFGESQNVPSDVSIPNRAYMNLLELPMLFYVLCLMLFVSGRVDAMFLNLAWSYVALRAIHSLIHVTYNNVYHRLIIFSLSNVVLIVTWGLFFWPLVAH
ncbi:MAG TPA: MAPEG family protein [Rhizomicrobium sp.]|nr:MAPEG family protein [Rhizomicrobium sp.]